jgi:purine nucleosidase
MKARPITVLMDVDTGVDDALGIILALHATNEIRIVGITTATGNTSSEQAALNTYFLLQQYQLDVPIPVVVGASESLDGRLATLVKDIHGPDGLGGVSSEFFSRQPPEQRRLALERQNAVDFILEAAERHGMNLRIVATGP